jgi:hypothetical protein
VNIENTVICSRVFDREKSEPHRAIDAACHRRSNSPRGAPIRRLTASQADAPVSRNG